VKGALLERSMTLLVCVDDPGGEERRMRLDRIERARVDRHPDPRSPESRQS
jgi:hypothetical protein